MSRCLIIVFSCLFFNRVKNQLESVIQREIESVENRVLLQDANATLPPTNVALLPEPSHPPPPPPPPPPSQFNPQQPAKANDEPIYEAVLPRDEGNASPPPLPTPPHKLSMRVKSPIAVETVATHCRPISPAAALSSPRQSRPNSRGSGTGVRNNRNVFVSESFKKRVLNVLIYNMQFDSHILLILFYDWHVESRDLGTTTSLVRAVFDDFLAFPPVQFYSQKVWAVR